MRYLPDASSSALTPTPVSWLENRTDPAPTGAPARVTAPDTEAVGRPPEQPARHAVEPAMTKKTPHRTEKIVCNILTRLPWLSWN